MALMLEKLFAVNKMLNEQDFFPVAGMHSLMLETRPIRHHKGKAVLTKAGRAINYERSPIEYGDAELRHYLGVVQDRLDNWVVLADFVPDHPLIWRGLLERKPEQDRTRIEQQHYRRQPCSTAVCGSPFGRMAGGQFTDMAVGSDPARRPRLNLPVQRIVKSFYKPDGFSAPDFRCADQDASIAACIPLPTAHRRSGTTWP